MKKASHISSGISQNTLCYAEVINCPQISVTNTQKANFWLKAHVHYRLVGEALLIEIVQEPAEGAVTISNIAIKALDIDGEALH